MKETYIIVIFLKLRLWLHLKLRIQHAFNKKSTESFYIILKDTWLS